MTDFPALIMAGELSTSSVLLLGLLAAFLTLDETSLAQTWFGQPLTAGLLTGLFCGDPVTGLAVGLPVQIILAGNLPVGQTFTGDPSGPMVAVVGAVILRGETLPAVLSGHGGPNLGLLGWLILAVGGLSAFGHVLVQAERRANTLWMLEGHRSLRDGSLRRMERLQVRCLGTTFTRGFLLGIIFLLLVYRLWIPLYDHLPLHVHRALALLPMLLTGLGIGTMIDRYGLKRSWHWVLGGLAVTLAAARLAG